MGVLEGVDELTKGGGIEAGCDGDGESVFEDELEWVSGADGGGSGIGEDGDGDEPRGDACDGGEVGVGRLRGGRLIEVLAEGMDRDAAAAAELGVGEAAASEIAEECVPAEVEDVSAGHGVISRTGTSAPSQV